MARRLALAVAVMAALGVAACGGGAHSASAPPSASGGGASTAPSPAPASGAGSARDASLALTRALHHQLRRAGRGGALFVYDVTSQHPVLAVRADVFSPPASVEKLYTTAALLRLLPAGSRLQTSLLGSGTLGRHGVWHGNLYLRGGGDPSLGSPGFNAAYEQGQGSTLAPLVERLRALGIRRVAGVVYGDESRFDTRRGGPSSGYAPDIGDLGGELGALTFDHGSTLALLHRRHGPGYVQSPAVDAAVELSRALRAAGIPARAARAPRPAPDGAAELARISSPPLSTLIRLTDLPSDDFYAEMLAKQLGLRFGGRGTTAAGAKVIASAVAAWGLHPRVTDGSGLSRSDLTSVRDVATLLARIWRTRLGEELYAALPVAGSSGTLAARARHTPAQGRCRAKTGTLNYVTTLAGYCRSRDGHQLAFALAIDGLGAPRAHLIADAMLVEMADHDLARPD